MKIDVCAGIDIGGTNTEIGIVDKNGLVIFSESISTRLYNNPESFVLATSKILYAGIEKTHTNLIGIGIGAPSANYYSGSIEFAPNMPWEGIIPLAKLFKSEMDVKCTLTNDANAAALGELLFGDAKQLLDFVVVTLGTGLGSGFVVNGEVLYGHDGFAGELGHIIIENNGRLCGCGRRGCLETYVSATGIVTTAKEWLLDSAVTTSLRNFSIDEISSLTVADAALNGDGFAIQIIDYTAEKLGFALANMVAITSPSHIFLYGGLAKSGTVLLNPVKQYFDKFILRNYKGKVELKLSSLTNQVAVLGAAALAWKEATRY